jgi:hypothetical protein
MARTWFVAALTMLAIFCNTACTREFKTLLGVEKLPEGTPELEKFKPKHSGLIVYMPKPRDEVASITDMFYSSYIYKHKDGNYTLAFGLVPGVFGPPTAYQKALDEACDRVVKALGGTVTFTNTIPYDRPTAQGDYYGFKSGKEIEGTIGEGGTWFRMRIFMLGQTCYQLIAVGSKTWINTPETRTFINSLEMVD